MNIDAWLELGGTDAERPRAANSRLDEYVPRLVVLSPEKGGIVQRDQVAACR